MWRLRGDAVQCNVCGWRGARLDGDHWHPETVCPRCRGQVRHRLLVAALDGRSDQPGLSEAELLAGRAVLHFAPERQLRGRIRRVASQYVTADFERGDTDLRLDISAMPSVASQSFNVLIACDVLEHVPDDAAAVREIFRILLPGGTAILSVPQKDSPSGTDEDPSMADESERVRRFGQRDHVRMYGDDFAARVRRVGFDVKVVTARNFPPEVRARQVLSPPQRSSHPLATNERRIYFCRKPA